MYSVFAAQTISILFIKFCILSSPIIFVFFNDCDILTMWRGFGNSTLTMLGGSSNNATTSSNEKNNDFDQTNQQNNNDLDDEIPF